MDLQVAYDASVAAAPSWFRSAVAYVVNIFDALITDPVSVSLAIGWGEENGNALGAGSAGQNQST